ncbi:hypothetical protein L6Q96_23045 [Candidatus Binatia bacterium]|nr:hypothetical protein [Candidatus Binatia bacterium]
MTAVQMKRAVDTVSQVSRNFGLSPSSNLPLVQKLSTESDIFSYRVFAEFGRDYDREGRRSRILVSVGQDKADGAVVVLIRDWDKTSETDFTESLKKSIEASLGADFAPHQVKVKRLYDMPSFYVP